MQVFGTYLERGKELYQHDRRVPCMEDLIFYLSLCVCQHQKLFDIIFPPQIV